MAEKYAFEAEVWEYEGPAAWFFVSLPEDVADKIESDHHGRTHGFGSVRVEVTVGSTTWSTSIFPDRKRGTYVLPVKKEVRRAEGMERGTVVQIGLRTVE